ncbi:MAG: site-specific integrase [Acidaminococcaceae bacterium]|nr:site-specific integrase [Acidaminococcaceae bacterium]MBQ9255784.1 site-specific integrase [Acidaminococcaceae bacterium]
MARRAWGEGTYIHVQPVKCSQCCDRFSCVIKDDKNGKCNKRDRVERWVYQYYVVGIDGKRKRKGISAKTRKNLTDRVEQLQVASGDVAVKTELILGQWLDTWSEKYLDNTVRKTTKQYYIDLVKYIPDNLRRLKLIKITPVLLQELYINLLKQGSRKHPGKGLSATTVRSVRSMLITCLESAIDNGYLQFNPAKKTRPPKLDKKEVAYMSEDEIKKLISVADSGEYYANLDYALDNSERSYFIKEWSTLIRLTIATGLRRGEVFGLTWSDIDFENQSLYVHNNLQDAKLTVLKTKYSNRIISVDKTTMERLKGWKSYQEKYSEEFGDKFNNNLNLIFTNSCGRPVRYDNFRIRYFDKMLKTAGLSSRITFHTLRHSHATQLLQAGINPKVISKRLGHSNVAFTLQIYTHVPDLERESADAIAKILNSDEPKK